MVCVGSQRVVHIAGSSTASGNAPSASDTTEGNSMNTEPDRSARSGDSLALWALVSAALGLVAVIVAYWMVLPAVVLGLVAVIVGVIARRRAALGARARDIATVAVCLGDVAMSFTPVLLVQTSGAEQYGRDCALNPGQDEYCP